jgi:hypothetical protein
VEHPTKRILGAQADIAHRLVEARDRPAVHLVVGPVAAMGPNDGGLVTEAFAVGGRATERLGPVGGEAFGVVGVESVTEGVTHHVVGHHPFVPGMSEPEHGRCAAQLVVHGAHHPILNASPNAINRSVPTLRLPLPPLTAGTAPGDDLIDETECRPVPAVA